MFREMRRKDKAKTRSETIRIMEEGTNGVLSVIGDEGYPYGVPVSYVYKNGKIYFHSAMEGHKLDAIKKEPKVSFCVVGADNIDAGKFTTNYKSVICFGKAHIAESDEEKQKILEEIVSKYSKDFWDGGMKYIKAEWDNCYAVEIEVEHMTGKGLAD
ncbi:MAG: pyridoxamine 5'-phosphate oxidase family protein [Bacillota bacterium]|nr:pyridoxamine 5'-phosphate oxidase family protein [Bacillota bacterium]